MHDRLRTRAGRGAAGIVVALALLVGLAGPAAAGGSDNDQNAGGRELEAAVTHDTVEVSVRGDSPWGECTYQRIDVSVIVNELLTDLLTFDWVSLVAPEGVLLSLLEGLEQTGGDWSQLPGEILFWHDVRCPNGLLEPGGRAIWPVTDAVPQRVVDALTRHAYDNQQLPMFYAHAAPAGTADDPFVTGVETHLWLSEARYQPVEAVAEIPGVARVTVTATPRDPVWRAGDGTPSFTCAGPGEPWNDGDRVAECGHVYRNSTSTSASGTFDLAVTVTWDVVSECVNLATGGGCGGSIMAPRVLTSTRPVTVAEIQAIVTGA